MPGNLAPLWAAINLLQAGIVVDVGDLFLVLDSCVLLLAHNFILFPAHWNAK
jgi:hypothetical protein